MIIFSNFFLTKDVDIVSFLPIRKFGYFKKEKGKYCLCLDSSVVEHLLGKEVVVGSIPTPG